MFGADTPLVMDALQMAAIAAAAGGGAIFLVLRRRKGTGARNETAAEKTRLEERVRVLERIATDQNSARLSEEIEALREAGTTRQLEGQTP